MNKLTVPFNVLLFLRREDQIGAVRIAFRKQIEQIDSLLGIGLLHSHRERVSRVMNCQNRRTTVADVTS